MPFLTAQGSFKPGKGFSAAGRVPDAPTFANAITAGIPNDKAVGVTLVAPSYNGRIADHNL